MIQSLNINNNLNFKANPPVQNQPVQQPTVQKREEKSAKNQDKAFLVGCLKNNFGIAGLFSLGFSAFSARKNFSKDFLPALKSNLIWNSCIAAAMTIVNVVMYNSKKSQQK